MIQKEFSENNNSTISSDFQCLKALINRIWNSDFPKKKKKKIMESAKEFLFIKKGRSIRL